jgi:hypothetical protein
MGRSSPYTKNPLEGSLPKPRGRLSERGGRSATSSFHEPFFENIIDSAVRSLNESKASILSLGVSEICRGSLRGDWGGPMDEAM